MLKTLVEQNRSLRGWGGGGRGEEDDARCIKQRRADLTEEGSGLAWECWMRSEVTQMAEDNRKQGGMESSWNTHAMEHSCYRSSAVRWSASGLHSE